MPGEDGRLRGRIACSGVTCTGHVKPDTWRVVVVCILLVLAIGSVYLQVRDHQFVSFDDGDYVTQNGHVLSGLNTESVKWAFSYSRDRRSYWHPLTWLSHMTDVELWDLDAGRHPRKPPAPRDKHPAPVRGARKMTGALWKSAFVAALFALHTMNVDSVAWIAERKNLLSTMFWLLVMLAYTSYARRPSVTRYLAVTGVFILGLLSKPMLVTLPFVLLLLDFWPLGRIRLPFPAQGGGPAAARGRSCRVLPG